MPDELSIASAPYFAPFLQSIQEPIRAIPRKFQTVFLEEQKDFRIAGGVPSNSGTNIAWKLSGMISPLALFGIKEAQR
jgi:hypothetical protein